MTIRREFWLALLAIAAVVAIKPSQAGGKAAGACPAIVIGRFDPSRDLLVVNYDIKPDVDDLHSAAAFATFVNRFPGCFDFVVVAGTYGNQGGEFIQANGLLNLAFGKRWLNADDDRRKATQAITERMGKTLRAGGSVWIAEGGQSDFSAEVVARLAAERALTPLLRQRVHVVQHSDWNEQAATPAKLSYLKAAVDYRRIADGNAAGNGTPGFATDDPSWWPLLLRDPKSGAVWAEAKRLADQTNPMSAYVNPSVAKGGLDFSDTVEVAYIFGLETIVDHEGFFRMVLDPSVLIAPYDKFPPQITRYMATPAILVFSKTSDWRHNEGIAGADRCFADLASSRGWGFVTTANGAVFRPEILSRFKLIVFNNMTGDAMSPAQRTAFEAWMADGGAWIGLHGAGDNSHTSWPWYDQQLIGPEFIGHPASPQFQQAQLATLAPEHPVMSGFPANWAATDEWYSFDAHPSAFGMKPLLGLSEASYDPFNRQYGPREDLRMGPKPADHPVVWIRCLGNARAFYSALGHQQFLYDDPNYRRLLANAVDWVLDRSSNKGC